MIFGILSVLFINIFFEDSLYNIILKDNADDLYSQASILSTKYSIDDFDIYSSDYDFTADITSLMLPAKSNAWIMAPSTQVLYSSDPSMTNLYFLDLSEYWGDNYYTTGNYYDTFEHDYLTAYSPIISDYRTCGYIVINQDLSVVRTEMLSISNFIYLTFFIIYFFSIIIIVVFHFSIYRPLKKIKFASSEFAKGNFKYNGLKIKSSDEIGILGEKINFMAQEMNTLDENHKKFIANISHDFRSPLTSIKGYVNAMLDGTIPPELYDKYMNIVLFETERLNKLTGTLLNMNTWNSKGYHLELSDFDIVPIIRNTLASFEGQCTGKKISVNVSLGESSYFVTADQIKIQQVIYNLIDNAIKFSPRNSTINVDISDKNDKIFISIKDFGCGIPKNSLNKIWDRFYKTDSSRGKDKAGTGLGLSIVKDIISAHNQNINVISTEGVGTEFIFTLSRKKGRFIN